MKTINLEGNGQLRTGRTELDVPHLDGKITYILPLIGPNYHKDVMGKVDSQKLYRPTTAQFLSLVDLALQNPKEPHCAEILTEFKRNYLWTGTQTTSFKDGAIVYDNINGKMPQTSKGLIKLLEEGDKRVRLVEPGFKTGAMSIPQFLKNKYTIAQIGEDMLPVAERIAKAYDKKEAYVFGIDKADSDVNRLTAVDSGWNGNRFGLIGSYDGSNYDGYVSGVVKKK